MDASQSHQPLLPRRALLAGALSAVTAGAVTALVSFGGLSAPARAEFQFSRGVGFAAGEEARLRGFLSQALGDERIHVTILGHTGDAGDADANLALSEERAALARDMAETLGIAATRITARGVGGAAPLAQETGESARAHQARLARVEVSLQMRQ